ncbi:MAG: NAD-dependent epimerase/dehydratase family protein [Eubacterium sp.]|nr:NAD-dependent epimerase/dehydratase family protein [Eubacterium sp.]
MDPVRLDDLKYIIDRIPYEMCEGKVFLIAGANGFLASYMVDTLMYLDKNVLQKGCRVIALCRNRIKAEKRFAKWLQERNFILHIQSVEEKVPDFLEADYIVHAASSSATRMFQKIPADILKANILGAYHLLEFAKMKKATGFLFFSSGAVYGNAEQKCTSIKEEDAFALHFNLTKNCYAEGKRAAEALCRSYFKQYGVPVKIVRIGHTYGPGIDLQDGHIYSDLTAQIIQKKALTILNGGAVRSFCYVADAVIAFFLILIKGICGESYNMTNVKETLSMQELALKLAHEAFPDRKLAVVCKNESSMVPKIGLNITKLSELGWKPEIDVVKGFRRTVQSFEAEKG